MYADADLEKIDAAVLEAERRHMQLRTEGELHLMGCSCGMRYGSDDPFAESHAHLRQVAAMATISAITGVCDTCQGSGLWEKFRGTLTCPDCDGLGETVLPLPPMHYRDLKGVVWVVTKQLGFERALVERRCSG